MPTIKVPPLPDPDPPQDFMEEWAGGVAKKVNTDLNTAVAAAVDMVNHPPHYTRGPVVNSHGKAVRVIECIEVIRHITDMRLASAMKYIWRVAFGGKHDDREDIAKAIFYLQDWLDHPIDSNAP